MNIKDEIKRLQEMNPRFDFTHKFAEIYKSEVPIDRGVLMGFNDKYPCGKEREDKYCDYMLSVMTPLTRSLYDSSVLGMIAKKEQLIKQYIDTLTKVMDDHVAIMDAFESL